MNKKMMLSIVVALLVVSGGAFAAWIVNSQTTITGLVTSESDILAFQYSDQVMEEMNTTDGSKSVQINNTIINQNGLIDAEINFELIAIDDEADSCNNTGDLEAVLLINNVAYNDSDRIVVQSGNTPVSIEVDAMRGSCPQQYSVTLGLIEAVI